MFKTWFLRGLSLFLVIGLLSGCMSQDRSSVPNTTEQASTITLSTEPLTEPLTEPPTEPPTELPTELPTEPPTELVHSALYIPGLCAEDVILYFNEVCLNAEFINAGDPTKLQKWTEPIVYICYGTYTDMDKTVLDNFVTQLNTIEGFPGMEETDQDALANLRIHFCDPESYLALMGDNFSGTDGGITFWYNDADEIYNAMIGYRTDIDQNTRNSVILEEIYNGLGPINDTALRPDSVIYTEYTTPQELSDIDLLLLKLLYHPQMQCSMDAAACEAVIRQLYY